MPAPWRHVAGLSDWILRCRIRAGALSGGRTPAAARHRPTAWTGQTAVVQDGPRSANSASRHSTSSRSVAPAGKGDGHHAGRRIGFGKLDRQQIEHGILAGRVHVPAFAGQHPLEAQRRAPAAVFRLGGLGAFPVEAVERHHQALFAAAATARRPPWPPRPAGGSETTSRSSSSRTTNLSWSMDVRAPGPGVIRQGRARAAQGPWITERPAPARPRSSAGGGGIGERAQQGRRGRLLRAAGRDRRRIGVGVVQFARQRADHLDALHAAALR